MNRGEALESVAKIKRHLMSCASEMHSFWSRRGWEPLGYNSFDKCCEEEFHFNGRYARRLVNRHKVIEDLGSPVDVIPSVRVAEQLKRLPTAQERQVAWRSMVKNADTRGGSAQVSEQTARNIVKSMLEKTDPKDTQKTKPVGHELDPKIAAALNEGTVRFKALLVLAKELQFALEEVVELDIGSHIDKQQIVVDLQNIITHICFAVPYAPCPYCHDQGDCRTCLKNGWINKGLWDASPQSLREAVLNYYEGYWRPTAIRRGLPTRRTMESDD